MSRLTVILAYLIRAANGFGLGAYVFTYVKIINSFWSHSAGKTQGLLSEHLALGKLFVLWIFVCILGLRQRSGYFAKRHGFRAAMFAGFSMRAVYFLCLVEVCSTSRPAGDFLGMLAVGGFAFAGCYVLLEGNYDSALSGLAEKHEIDRSIFGWTAATQSGFAVLGSLAAVGCLGADLRPRTLIDAPLLQVPFAVVAALSMAVALLALLLPTDAAKERPTIRQLRDDVIKAFRSCAPFRWLTWLGACSAIVYHGMALVVPLIVLGDPNHTPFEWWLILGFGALGAQTVGNLRQAYARSREQRRRWEGLEAEWLALPEAERAEIAAAARGTAYRPGTIDRRWLKELGARRRREGLEAEWLALSEAERAEIAAAARARETAADEARLGRLCLNELEKRRTRRTTPDLISRIIRSNVLMALATLLFCVTVMAGGSNSPTMVAVLLIAFGSHRYFFGVFDSAHRDASTAVLEDQHTEDLKEPMMSLLEWWKAAGGLIVTLASIGAHHAAASASEATGPAAGGATSVAREQAIQKIESFNDAFLLLIAAVSSLLVAALYWGWTRRPGPADPETACGGPSMRGLQSVAEVQAPGPHHERSHPELL